MTMAIAVGFFLRSLILIAHELSWQPSTLTLWKSSPGLRPGDFEEGDLSPHHSVSQNRDEELMQGMLHNSLRCKREWIAVCGLFVAEQ
jgi:hypothetical protein